jgi:hypothetical protein
MTRGKRGTAHRDGENQRKKARQEQGTPEKGGAASKIRPLLVFLATFPN